MWDILHMAPMLRDITSVCVVKDCMDGHGCLAKLYVLNNRIDFSNLNLSLNVFKARMKITFKPLKMVFILFLSQERKKKD